MKRTTKIAKKVKALQSSIKKLDKSQLKQAQGGLSFYSYFSSLQSRFTAANSGMATETAGY